MIPTVNDVHQQFADFFRDPGLRPYAYLVSKKLSEGHICLELAGVDAEIPHLPAAYQRTLAGAGIAVGQLPQVAAETGMQPFILHRNRLYLQRYFSYETMILERIAAFLRHERGLAAERAGQLRAQIELIATLFIETEAPGDLPEAERINWQLAAAVSGVLNNFTIITGGPGTGKTTTVAKLLALLQVIDPETKVALAAPTGKAAMRLGESLRAAGLDLAGNIPVTLHRLLKYVKGSPYFRHNADTPLPHDVVIVDEASMIDAALFAKLLDAIGADTRLILLGDKDQLASVEAGSLLGDLCQTQQAMNVISTERVALINNLNPEPGGHITTAFIAEEPDSGMNAHIIELKRSRRFMSTEGIGKLSRAIISSDIAAIEAMMQSGDDARLLFDEAYSEEIFEEFVAGFEAYIVETDTLAALYRFNNLRILCAVRGGDQGVRWTNKRVEDSLRKRGLIQTSGEFYVNRPVMITGNHYDLDLFNGDIGLVRQDSEGVLKVYFESPDGGLRDLLPAYIPLAETVFAMTVHKSQGSEYAQVLAILPKTANEQLMTRELLYTAVTRAKERIILQGTAANILKIASATVQRASGLAERFNELRDLQ